MKKRYVSLITTITFIIICSFVTIRLINERKLAETGSKEAKLAIYSVNTEEQKVAISFDEGWGFDQTEEILDILDKHDATATFFLVGAWVETYPQNVKLIAERGHELGNHTDTHQRLTKLSEEKIKTEILEVHNKVKEITGVNMSLLRPPFGDYDKKVVNAADACDYYTVKWNVDSYDWRNEGIEQIVKSVLESEYLRNGSIILFHNNRKYTKDALDIILTDLKEQGYEIVSISELIYPEDYYLDATGRQFKNN
ncbi:polysaccharide deacetylase family sporulation protein PdaB [Natranaerovirga pectinivora]|uniref:Polysaccharide deacetylase family sporulation protein PdaB n=1 Tax=Natranaerovirga pectinivora TaxID=682400 RepID=A0A4R3MNP4_9FIRM|nr:polysaccharide deacetylase family protein [Natranaerovirga pectinivora]TCT14309.1 polysaccharide deacetylase family sporulation protein PdaB [Natranaerovirga pectinivora]